MPTAGPSTVTLAPAEDPAAGTRGLLEALAAPGAVRAGGPLRIEQPIRTGDPLAWLADRPAMSRIYWRGREGPELAGAGVALESHGPVSGRLQERLDALGPAARVFGAQRFDADRPPDASWSAFPAARFHLPLVEMRREAGATTLAVHLAADPEEAAAQRRIAGRLLEGGRSTGHPAPAGRPAVPGDDETAWHERVEALLAAIRAGRLEKVVLARSLVRARRGMDPLALLDALRHRQPGACLFLVAPSDEAAFLGASPEHLYHRRGRDLTTEALAGTRPRREEADADARAAADLAASTKDLREHDAVRRHLLAHLEPLCDRVAAAARPSVRTLPDLHHLCTTVEARLREGVGDADLLAALHPTPAVCGTPTAAAYDLLRQTEPFDRGLYAGPVGLFGTEVSEVAVAIRSALVRGDSVQLFAGAGVVDGSDPAAEWQETADKMRTLDALLETGDGP